MTVPALRIESNGKPANPGGEYVLYWMVGARRTRFNFALDHAVDLARELGKGLVVLEAVRADYPWLSDRFTQEIAKGMAANQRSFAETSVTYHPYVEPNAGAGHGLVMALCDPAAAIVADDTPVMFLPRMVRAVQSRVPVRMDVVDGNGIIPLRITERAFPSAHTFRRSVHKNVARILEHEPKENAFAGEPLPSSSLPEHVLENWPATDLTEVDVGGAVAGQKTLQRFLQQTLSRYGSDRNHPDLHGTSGLSTAMHFGHVGSHQIFAALSDWEDWNIERTNPKVVGQRAGFWGMSPDAEAFVDQFLTWRELSFNGAVNLPNYTEFRSLPAWALKTLDDHRGDKREWNYSLAQFDDAMTHDEIWNAAQRQLRREGVMHNYLRMLWGKKIIEWCDTPERALEVMIELNNKYALDGRDPNSYSGIFWTLGRYDRAWGPERPIFGKVRWMTSDSTRKKLKLKAYLDKYAE